MSSPDSGHKIKKENIVKKERDDTNVLRSCKTNNAYIHAPASLKGISASIQETWIPQSTHWGGIAWTGVGIERGGSVWAAVGIEWGVVAWTGIGIQRGGVAWVSVAVAWAAAGIRRMNQRAGAVPGGGAATTTVFCLTASQEHAHVLRPGGARHWKHS